MLSGEQKEDHIHTYIHTLFKPIRVYIVNEYKNSRIHSDAMAVVLLWEFKHQIYGFHNVTGGRGLAQGHTDESTSPLPTHHYSSRWLNGWSHGMFHSPNNHYQSGSLGTK